jgi:hypothetical protein
MIMFSQSCLSDFLFSCALICLLIWSMSPQYISDEGGSALIAIAQMSAANAFSRSNLRAKPRLVKSANAAHLYSAACADPPRNARNWPPARVILAPMASAARGGSELAGLRWLQQGRASGLLINGAPARPLHFQRLDAEGR